MHDLIFIYIFTEEAENYVQQEKTYTEYLTESTCFQS